MTGVPRWFRVLAALVLALAALLLIRRLPQKPDSIPLPVLPADPVRVEIKTAARVIVLEKTADAWRLTAPLAYPADEERVKELLGGLRDLSTETTLTDRPETHAQYALNDSSAVTVSAAAAGGTPVVWVFGRTADDGVHVFLKRPDSPAVYLARDPSRFLLDSPLRQWRERRVFLHKPEDEIRRVVLTRDGRAYDLHKSSEEWRLGGRKADTEKTESFLSTLNVLSVEDFIDPPDSVDLRKWGLDAPKTTLSVRYESGLTVDLRAGRPDPENRRVPVRRGDEDVLLWMADYDWKAVREIPETLLPEAP